MNETNKNESSEGLIVKAEQSVTKRAIEQNNMMTQFMRGKNDMNKEKIVDRI